MTIEFGVVQDHAVWKLMRDVELGDYQATEDDIVERAVSGGWLLQEHDSLYLTNKSHAVLNEVARRFKIISELYDLPIKAIVQG